MAKNETMKVSVCTKLLCKMLAMLSEKNSAAPARSSMVSTIRPSPQTSSNAPRLRCCSAPNARWRSTHSTNAACKLNVNPLTTTRLANWC